MRQLMKDGLWTLRRAPLGEWDTYRVFDSANLCNQDQESVTDYANKELLKKTLTGFDAAKTLSMSYARCVASDDPRLKGK